MYARQSGSWSEFATGNLDDGNQDGEILTWDTATANWTHDDTMIVKGGNVGIGATSSSPPVKYHWNLRVSAQEGAGTLLQLNSRHLRVNTTLALRWIAKRFYWSNRCQRLRFQVAVGGDHLVIDDTGNVGIGTTFSGNLRPQGRMVF